MFSLPMDTLFEQLSIRCVQNLRYIDEVFDSQYFARIIMEQVIEQWNSPLRENFIEVIPEVIMDYSMHTGNTY